MNTKDFLESNGYRLWKQENEQSHSTMYFQKRVDGLYPDTPVCECNDKLFINIEVWTMEYNGNPHTSCTINMVHERPEDEWCDLKIYSLTEEQINTNLKSYEDKMVALWEVFHA